MTQTWLNWHCDWIEILKILHWLLCLILTLLTVLEAQACFNWFSLKYHNEREKQRGKVRFSGNWCIVCRRMCVRSLNCLRDTVTPWRLKQLIYRELNIEQILKCLLNFEQRVVGPPIEQISNIWYVICIFVTM